MPSLRSTLSDLAESFTSSVIDVIRNTSLDELLAEAGGGRASNNGRKATAPVRDGRSAAPAVGRAPTAPPSGRLRRRSPEEISEVLSGIVALLKKNREGLRAENIRAELGMQAKEMPRILKEGLATRKLKSKGQKRATTYFAA